MSGPSAPVSLRVADAVATVTVDNPPVNAMDDATLIALRDVAGEIAADEQIRAVVVTGTGGKAFLAGADLRELRDHLGRPAGLAEHLAVSHPAFAAWRDLPQPTIAAVQANAVGGGMEFALNCDLIVADPRARFGLPEVTLGLMPGGGGTQRLPRRIGAAAATELLLLGRLIDAQRACELGLVNLVTGEDESLAEAVRIAERIAALPAVAVQSIKRAVRQAIDRGLTDGLRAEAELFLGVAASSDAREGATAFLEKRPPSFVHR